MEKGHKTGVQAGYRVDMRQNRARTGG